MGLKNQAAETLNTLKKKMQNHVQSYLELAVDYGNCGLWNEAIEVLSHLDNSKTKKASTYPMLYYYLGFFWEKKADTQKALKYYQLAAKMPTDYCFPFRLESIAVLTAAMKNNPADAHAPYYLGNLLYEKQPEEAIKQWEKSRALDDTFAIVHRNLGLAYYRTENDTAKAIASYEKAIACNNQDQRLFYELDVLYDAARVSPRKRLALLQKNHKVIADNNVSDALSREVLLLALLGRYDEALEIINNNFFRQWEGISKAYNTYVDAHLLRGLEHFNTKRYRKALKDYLAALEFPKNLHVAKPYSGGRSCQEYYFLGTAYEALGDTEKAIASFQQAVAERQRAGLSENYYYRALALRRIGRETEARQIFDALIKLGQDRLEGSSIDFFAKFGEIQTQEDKMASAHYLLGLGYLGNGRHTKAKAEFAQAAELNINHLWAKIQLNEIK
jgi:tetratricopeptide (TPR) repeat protein